MNEIPTTIKSKELVEKKREQIVVAAIKLFSQKGGFHRATLRELAEEAGLSHGNIYDYVGTKEDILFLMHQFINKHADESLTRSIEGIDDPLEKLRRIIRSECKVIYAWSGASITLYREAHLLNKALLRKLLKREREHIQSFELVLQEGIKKGLLQECNTRLVANLIKVMVDSWVIKGWDLRGHVTEFEIERAILNLVLRGLIKEEVHEPQYRKDMPLRNKSIVIINGGTFFGKEMSSYLLSLGARVAIHSDELSRDTGSRSMEEGGQKVRFYGTQDYGAMTPSLFQQIINECGPVDIVIQDLGVSETEKRNYSNDMMSIREIVKTNLCRAQDLSTPLVTEITKRESGKLLFLAPCAWEKSIDTIGYEIAKAGTISLTQSLAKKIAGSRASVNCIIPGYITGPNAFLKKGEKPPELVDHIPMEYLGEVSDILETVCFLISDSSRYLTGQVLEVTGGL